ncbi:hypothetical protein [Cohnella nanjingensis]|uniref:Uncharacterized protein n=1 Tax=Cohnella nanjingensis TaxID=1387779 RepID=A0A7X0VFA5_9BACL|nr:hypothetical protein [Cohnella nanjingensis]MBB6671093.1 hypothetical protein [Cohnella nanjingensis]
MKIGSYRRTAGARAAKGALMVALAASLAGCQSAEGTDTSDSVIADVYYAPTVGQDVYGSHMLPSEGVRGLMR